MQFRWLHDSELVKHSATGAFQCLRDLSLGQTPPSTFVPPLSKVALPPERPLCQCVDSHPMRWTRRPPALVPIFRGIFSRVVFSIISRILARPRQWHPGCII